MLVCKWGGKTTGPIPIHIRSIPAETETKRMMFRGHYQLHIAFLIGLQQNENCSIGQYSFSNAQISFSVDIS